MSTDVVSIDTVDAEKVLRELGSEMKLAPARLRKGLAWALNRATKSTRTLGIRVMAYRYAAPRSEFDRKLSVFKANSGKLVATLTGRGRNIILSRYKAREKKVMKRQSPYTRTIKGKAYSVTPKKRRPYYGVTVTVLRERGRKRVGGGAFLRRFNGPELIVWRDGDNTSSLDVLYGPSIVGFLNSPNVRERLREHAETRTRKDLESYIRNELRKLGA